MAYTLITDEYLDNVTHDMSCFELKVELSKYLNESTTPKSLMTIQDCFIDQYGNAVIKIVGGLNGDGKWEDYFQDMSDFIKRMRDKNIEVWLMDLDNDTADDVFFGYFGINLIKE